MIKNILFAVCFLSSLSMTASQHETIRQRQERAMYAPHLSAPTSVGQVQVQTMVIHTAASQVSGPNK